MDYPNNTNNTNNNNINENIDSNEQLKENPFQINNNFNTISSNIRYDEPIDRNIFHKKKKDYNIFTINPEVEEIPTFTFENDRNLKSYKGRINNKYSLIEQYSKNYLEYMKKFENKRKTPYSSPFLVYQEKTRNNNNIINQFENNNIQENQNRTVDVNLYSNPIKIKNLSINNNNNNNIYDNNQSNNINNNNSNNNNIDNNVNNDLNINQNIEINNNHSRNHNVESFDNIFNFSSRSGEITNPNYFFQRNNRDYYKYRLEQKKYLDYNYQIIKNRLNKRIKREPDINPYNPINEQPFENGKSDLLHNPILNPINNYSYNKYLEKEVNLGNRYRKSMSNENYNINNYNKKLNYNFSTLQNAGSQLLNN